MVDGLTFEPKFDDVVIDPSFGERIVCSGWHLHEYRDLYQGLVRFMDAVLNTDQVPFEIRNDRGFKFVFGRTNGLGLALRWCWSFMDLCWPGYHYSADMQLFFDCYGEFEPIQFDRAFRAFASDPNCHLPDGTIVAERFNTFVAYLRKQAKTHDVKRKMRDWKRGLDAQSASIIEYLDELVQKHPDLILLRFDRQYAQSVALDCDAMRRMTWQRDMLGEWQHVPMRSAGSEQRLETRARIDVAQAMRDREAFFDKRLGADRELFEGMVGYIDKMESGGREGANHSHDILFFDASSVGKQDLERKLLLAQQRWSRVTGGSGIIFNCHAPEYEEKLRQKNQWSLDPVRKGNPVQFETLKAYVRRYFAKDDDQMLRVKPTAKSRTLTRGLAG
jgi:hypothetical protein